MTSPPTEPVLARLADLHPTQITVGFREVAQKRLRLRARLRKAGEGRAPKLVAPVVLASDGALYLIDRHHLACAMKAEGVEGVQIRQVADFSTLPTKDLWSALEAEGWCRPFDADGRRRPFGDIPPTLDALLDDPFRSLASALRRSGGFTKRAAPFSEFVWADFLRTRIPSHTVAMDFDSALDHAMSLARTPAAQHLPGWVASSDTGPSLSASIASPYVGR